MKQYTGWQYLLIDVANQSGRDKLLFEERIQWATDNLADLESLADQAETKPLYLKAVMAIRKAQKGIPTGHLVGLDACCSGIQVMSALTGCNTGAESTGMVDPNKRADAYTAATDEMATILGNAVNVSRTDAKRGLMTSFYGSKAVPKELFGEDTPELDAFYQAAHIIAPGAWELLQDLLASWQPYALQHSWKMPDGFDARVKVMKKNTVRIEVDELNHATFSYEFYENQGAKNGLSNAANLTHSVDGWILRSMHRRLNYDWEVATEAARAIEIELIERSMGEQCMGVCFYDTLNYYVDQYDRSTLADIVILPYLNEGTVQYLSTEHLQALARILVGMLQHPPFELVTVHDEFKAHANNMNQVRWMYREIMAEIAESEVLNDLLSQINGVQGTFQKMNFNLPELIRKSNYALC
jgi:DNA-dependent RNA polymerase